MVCRIAVNIIQEEIAVNIIQEKNAVYIIQEKNCSSDDSTSNYGEHNSEFE